MLSYQIKVLKLVMVITLEWSFKLEGNTQNSTNYVEVEDYNSFSSYGINAECVRVVLFCNKIQSIYIHFNIY